MKNLSIIVCSAVVFYACSTNKLSNFDYGNGPNPWINAFKDKVFISCLYQSYPAGSRDSIFRAMARFDLFNPYDDFNDYESSNKKLLDSLGRSVSQNMPPYWHTDEPGSNEKNVYMCTCLHFYSSSQLNKIARSEYKRYNRSLKKQSR